MLLCLVWRPGYAQDLNFEQLNQDLAEALPSDSLVNVTKGSIQTKHDQLILAKALRRDGKVEDSKIQLKNVQSSTTNLPGFQLYCLNELGEIAIEQGQLDTGFLYFDQVHDLISNNTIDVSSNSVNPFVIQFYNKLGVLYAKTGKSDISRRYLGEALQRSISRGISDLQRGDILMNLGIYHDFGGNIDSASYFYQQALSLFGELNSDEKRIGVYHNLGAMHTDMGSADTALHYLRLAAGLLDSNSHLQYDLGFNKLKSGRVLHQLKRLDEASQYLNECLDVVSGKFPYLEGEALEILKEVYANQGNYKQAYQTSLLYDSLSLHLQEKNTEQIAQEMEGRYQNELKAKEIEWLTEKNEAQTKTVNRMRIIIAGGVLILILLFVSVYFYRGQSKARKERNEQLRKLNSDKTRFLSHIAHEVRTPITLISGPLTETKNNLVNKKTDGIAKSVNLALNQVDKLEHLVEELMDLSKLDDGAIKPEWTRTNLSNFLDRVTGTFDTLAQQKKIKYQIENKLPSNQEWVTDYSKLEKCINNLLVNAFKFTSEGGTIEVKSHLKDDLLSVEVADSGVGISENEQDKVFQRYYQSETNSLEGTGIGLSLVRDYIELLEGEIHLTSDVGKGSSFVLRLPLHMEMANAKPYREVLREYLPSKAPRPHSDLSEDQEKPHILIAEDNADMADFIRDVLEPGYRVSLANTGAKAWDRLRQHQYSLLITDVMMPDLNGFELVEKVRSFEKLGDLPVLMLSAMALPEDKIYGFQIGVDDYMAKPFHPGELRVRVKHLLELSNSRKTVEVEEVVEEISAHEKLIGQARQLVLENLSNSEFTVKALAEKLNYSERNLQRLVRKQTGLTSVQFIREIRLLSAYNLLQKREMHTVAEVSYAVGIDTVSYFSRVFTNRFGVNPKELIKL